MVGRGGVGMRCGSHRKHIVGIGFVKSVADKRRCFGLADHNLASEVCTCGYRQARQDLGWTGKSAFSMENRFQAIRRLARYLPILGNDATRD